MLGFSAGARVYGAICLRLQLSKNRRVTLQEFKGKTLVSIREYYIKDGKEMPSSKGAANLTVFLELEDWISARIPDLILFLLSSNGLSSWYIHSYGKPASYGDLAAMSIWLGFVSGFSLCRKGCISCLKSTLSDYVKTETLYCHFVCHVHLFISLIHSTCKWWIVYQR